MFYVQTFVRLFIWLTKNRQAFLQYLFQTDGLLFYDVFKFKAFK